MTILITGGTGSLGSELQKIFPDGLCPKRNELDITNQEHVENYFKNNSIDVNKVNLFGML